jgi:dihydroxyacetone kinase-like predicted kinase
LDPVEGALVEVMRSGKPKVEVVTDEKQDYISALRAVNERLKQA